MKSRAKRPGFSLVELLIVVSLMGILAALALPTLNPGIYEELQAAGQLLASDVAYARSLAVANNSSYRLSFDAAQNRYVLEHTGANRALDVLPQVPFRSPADLPTEQSVDLDDLPHLTGQSVRLAGVTSAGGIRLTPEILEFGPLGETARTQETVIWLAAGHNQQTRYLPLHVNPVSGLTTLGEYTAQISALSPGVSGSP